MVNIPLFTGFYTSQLVQDFFHQPHHCLVCLKLFCSTAYIIIDTFLSGLPVLKSVLPKCQMPNHPKKHRAVGSFKEKPVGSFVSSRTPSCKTYHKVHCKSGLRHCEGTSTKNQEVERGNPRITFCSSANPQASTRVFPKIGVGPQNGW